MTKYYDWDEHCWINEEEYTEFKNIHTISAYPDDWMRGMDRECVKEKK